MPKQQFSQTAFDMYLYPIVFMCAIIYPYLNIQGGFVKLYEQDKHLMLKRIENPGF